MQPYLPFTVSNRKGLAHDVMCERYAGLVFHVKDTDYQSQNGSTYGSFYSLFVTSKTQIASHKTAALTGVFSQLSNNDLFLTN